MPSARVPMTIEDVQSLWRTEKSSQMIQSVRPDLAQAMADLISSLSEECAKLLAQNADPILSDGKRNHAINTERSCRSILEMRSKKIALMAHRFVIGDKSIDLSFLTPDERVAFDEMVTVFRGMMTQVDRLRGKVKTVPTRLDDVPAATPPSKTAPASIDAMILQDDGPMEEPIDDIPDPEMLMEEPAIDPEDAVNVPEATAPAEETVVTDAPASEEIPVGRTRDDTPRTLIRVLEDLPVFAGPDRDYDLRKEDVIMMPKIMADVLIGAEKAVAVKPTP